ncbi:MAG: flippase-like domain-containing protein [Acidobacteria bacterium]|nr:flippase-like domain-containing protein [Acidobacteriota bacterium]
MYPKSEINHSSEGTATLAVPASSDSQPTTHSTSRRSLWALVQILLGGLALVFVLRKANLTEVVSHLKQVNLWYVLLAFGLNLVMLAAMSLRLSLLAWVHSRAVLFREVLLAQFHAAFINGFVPGSLGGDAVRFYTLERTMRNKPLVLATLIVERLIGTWGVLLTAALALAANHEFLNPRQWLGGLVFFAGVVTVLTVVLFSQYLEQYLLAFLAFGWRQVSHWWGATFVKDIIKRMLGAARAFRAAPGQIWLSLVVSLFVRLVWVLSAYSLALALGLNLSLPILFGFISLVDVARMLPISPPNGLGVREALLVYLLGQIGIGHEAALSYSLLIYALMTANAILGGLLSITQGVWKLRQ